MFAAMKIDPTATSPIASVRRADKRGGKDDGAFAKSLDSGQRAPQTRGNSPAASAGGIDALLALQEVPDAVSGRAKARRRAESVLDRLEELRMALLFGELPVSLVERLAQEAAELRTTTTDSRLQAVLDEIELRAQVELAKLGR